MTEPNTMVFMTTEHKKVTIRDVARLANVSYGTVSRFLNGSEHVSKDASERIAAAIKESKYTPNKAARSLAQQRTSTVALIIPAAPGWTSASTRFARRRQIAATRPPDESGSFPPPLSASREPY